MTTARDTRADPTYYDRPLLNEPVWEWPIATYYYVGGLSGASLVLGAAVQLKGLRALDRLVNRCHWIGFIGCSISGALLTYDLGRPERFVNMLRVFRPTSPMNVGAWILSAAGGASMLTVLLRGKRGVLGRIGEAVGYVAGAFGMGLATYTGVLVANTAVPVWQESRHVLPILFGSSAVASAGLALELFVENAQEHRITKAFGTAGQIAELTAAIAMEKQASVVPQVGRPLKRGLSGVLWKTAAVCTATSLALGLLPSRGRTKRIAAGIFGTLGSLALRFAVAHAGVASARDPRASFHLQRSKGAA